MQIIDLRAIVEKKPAAFYDAWFMTASGNRISVAAAQLLATTLDQAARALETVLGAVDQAAARGAELLVLPECAYPAYVLPSVEAYRSADVLSNDEFLALLSAKAKHHGMHLICGFIEDRSDGLGNTAVLIDDAGKRLGLYRKTFMWGDDSSVFAPGESLPVFDTRLGRIGIAICADVRAPEVTAGLACQGAEIIAIPTCWVNVAKTPGEYYNPQPDFMIRARSRELSLPFVCANKYGVETNDVGYCGYSLIVDADASVLAKAPPDESVVLTAELRLAPGRPQTLPDWTRERILSSQPAEPPGVGEPEPLTVAAVPTPLVLPSDEGADPLRTLAEKNVTVVASSLPSADVAEEMDVYARSIGMRLIGFPFEMCVHWDRFGSYGVVCGEDVLPFAPARAMTLDGAAILFVTDVPDDMALLRTRAAENRVFLVGTSDRSAVIVGPDGAVIDRCEGDDLRPLVQPIDLGAAQDKYAYRDTHIFEQRRPKAYAPAFR